MYRGESYSLVEAGTSPFASLLIIDSPWWLDVTRDDAGILVQFHVEHDGIILDSYDGEKCGVRVLVSLSSEVLVSQGTDHESGFKTWQIVDGTEGSETTNAMLTASNIEATSFTLTANAPLENVSKYEFYIDGNLEKTLTSDKSSVTYSVTEKTPETSYVCKVRVYDESGNYIESNEITVTTELERALIATKVKVGDFVDYDAGNWEIFTDSDKIISSGGNLLWSENDNLPVEDSYFGGLEDKQSRNSNSIPYDAAPEYSGWRVWSVDGNVVTIISAGHTESFYHADGNSIYNQSVLQNRDCTMYENEYAKTNSARLLTKEDMDSWYNKNIDSTVTDTYGVAFPDASEKPLINMINLSTNCYYWLATAKGNSSLYSVGATSAVGDSMNCALGLRVLITLDADVLVNPSDGDGSSEENAWKIVGIEGSSETDDEGNAIPNAKESIKVEYDVTEATAGNVNVTLIDNSGVDGYTIKYQIGTTTGQWLDYTAPIEMTDNGIIYARLYNSAGEYNGTVTITVSNIDRSAPVIEYVEVKDIKAETAVCYLSVSDYKLKQIDFYGDGTLFHTETFDENLHVGSVDGSLNINGLSESTDYELYIVVTDSLGNTTTSDTIEFSTIEGVDNVAPEITQYEISDITSSSAVLTVMVSDKSDTEYISQIEKIDLYLDGELAETIEYNGGINDSLRREIGSGIKNTTHEVYFVVTDRKGNSTTSETKSFTLLDGEDNLGPEITLIEARNVTCNEFDIYVEAKDITDTDALAGIVKLECYFDGELNYEKEDVLGKTLDFTRTFIVAPNHTYELYVIVTDADGNSTRSETLTVTTPDGVDNLGPEIQNFEIVDVTAGTIEFALQAVDVSDTDCISYIGKIEANVNGQSYVIAEGEYITADLTRTITGLYQNRTYEIYLVLTDVKGNSTTSETLTVTTPDGTDNLGPRIITFEARDITYDGCVVYLEAEDISDTDYVSGIERTEFYFDGSLALSSGCDNERSIIYPQSIGGFDAGSTHTFHMVLIDAEGNTTTTETISITTLVGTDTLAPTASLEVIDVTTDGFKLVMKGTDVSDTDYVSGIAKYELYNNGNLLKTYDTTSDIFTVTFSSLESGASYEFYAIIYDAAGNHTQTATVVATTLLPQTGEPSVIADVGDFVNYSVTVNGVTYNKWRILHLDTNGHMEIVCYNGPNYTLGSSTSSTSKTHYLNAIQLLNTASEPYKNGTYGYSARHLGSNPTNPSSYATISSSYVSTSSTENAYTVQTHYETDLNSIHTFTTSQAPYVLSAENSTGGDYCWMAARNYYYEDSPQFCLWLLRANGNWAYSSIYTVTSSGDGGRALSFALAPVVSLESGILLNTDGGVDGTINKPWTLTK